MFSYTEEELLADAKMIASTSSSENFGMRIPSHSETFSQGPFVYDPDTLYGQVQRHADNVRFLNFAAESISAESIKSSRYSDVMNLRLAEKRNSDDFKIAGIREEIINHSQFHDLDSKYAESLLPISIDVSEINKSASGSLFAVPASSERISIKQLRKDVERDRFTLNGAPLIGSELKLEGVISAIELCCRRALQQCFMRPMNKSVGHDLAIEILSKASRTNSGGIAYQCLHYLIKPSSIVITPLSTLAKPLNISITVGSFSESPTRSNASHDNWGLISHVDCSTFFSIKANDMTRNTSLTEITEDTSENQIDTKVQIIFEDAICVPITLKKEYSISDLAGITGTSGNSGKVTVQKLIL